MTLKDDIKGALEKALEIIGFLAEDGDLSEEEEMACYQHIEEVQKIINNLN